MDAFITLNEGRALNLGEVQEFVVTPNGDTVTAYWREGRTTRYDGPDAHAIRHYMRTRTPNCYPDHIELTSSVSVQSAQARAAGG